MSRITSLLNVIKALPKAKRKKFLREMHKDRSFTPSPNERMRITTGGEYEPLSGSDSIRLLSQQASENEEFVRVQELLKLLGEDIFSDKGIAKEKEILEIIEALMTPVQRNRNRGLRLRVLNADDNIRVPF